MNLQGLHQYSKKWHLGEDEQLPGLTEFNEECPPKKKIEITNYCGMNQYE